MVASLQRFYSALLFLSCVSMVACLVAISLNMLTRVVDGWTIAGLDGYAGYAIAAALFFAMPAAFRHGDHITGWEIKHEFRPHRVARHWRDHPQRTP